MDKLLSPTNDYVFKRVFTDAPELLVNLINDLRPQALPVTELRIINPEVLPNEISGKLIRLDVLAKDQYGSQYNIEIQVYRFQNWHQRGLYYLSRMIETQLKAGGSYDALGNVVGVHLLDFDLFTQTESERAQAIWCFEMRDLVQAQVSMGEALQLNIIELDKADRLRMLGRQAQDWVSFFKHSKEGWEMSDIQHKPVQAAMEKVRALSQNQEEWWHAVARERALLDEATLLKQAHTEGLAEGLAEGKNEGMAEGLRRGLMIAVQGRFGTLPNSVQKQIDQATVAELNHWLEQVLIAQQLEDVFAMTHE